MILIEQPQAASPHHVAFVADPQLVDPHTYPGRRWPFTSLTEFYTDLYLYRTYTLLQEQLEPDTTFFVGDLFDGGREWATQMTRSPEERYHPYGDSYWQREYQRFSRVFFHTWKLGSTDPESSGRARKIIASLPGNHDVGFGLGVQKAVADRFFKFFGAGNRVDIVGNHSFVSVDTPSLSAIDQTIPKDMPEPEPGTEIWRQSYSFLDRLPQERSKAILAEMRALRQETERSEGTGGISNTTAQINADFPTILLSHVPLYRSPGTPCGPLREKYPPSSDPPPIMDDRNAIRVEGGYQYQNVLTDDVTRTIIDKVGHNITQVYSGDDHDYCEVVHSQYPGNPHEITIKSMSMAMGVRRPGFLLASLWNPVDVKTGKALHFSTHSATIQNQLCLLPDQIGIFIYYGEMIILSILLLFLHSIYLVFGFPILKTSTNPVNDQSELESLSSTPIPRSFQQKPDHAKPSSSSSCLNRSQPGNGRARSSTLSRGSINFSSTASSGLSAPNFSSTHEDTLSELSASRTRSRAWSIERAMLVSAPISVGLDYPIGESSRALRLFSQVWRSVKTVALFGGLWYLVLIWSW